MRLLRYNTLDKKIKTEVGSINRQKFIAELSKLLGFMSSWDREATIAEYNAMFDAAENEAELLGTLGSPTRLAITLANNYVPSPAPVKTEASTPALSETGEDIDIVSAVEQAVERATTEGEEPEELAGATASAIFTDTPDTLQGKNLPRRRLRILGLVVYCPLALLIGLPIAMVLIALGLPFLLVGGAVGTVTVWSALELLSALNMVSDTLVVAGAGLALAALSLLVLWFGLWLSITLGRAWLSGVVFRLGGVMCWKKEVPKK